jgi:hypothetical protein
LIFEVRGFACQDRGGKDGPLSRRQYRVVADCENGRLVIPSYEEAIVYDKDDKEIKRWKAGGDHFGNFIKAIRSRKHTDLVADAEEGHISAALCHTANISYRLGKKESSDKIRDAIKNDKDATEALGRMEEHLAANDVDCKKTPVTLGAVLKMDVKGERVIDNAAANKMLTREYRKPFVVPERFEAVWLAKPPATVTLSQGEGIHFGSISNFVKQLDQSSVLIRERGWKRFSFPLGRRQGRGRFSDRFSFPFVLLDS